MPLKVVISLPESAIRVFVLSPFFFFSPQQQQTAQSTPSDHSSSLHISSSSPLFFSSPLNSGQSHINTQGSIHSVYSQRRPHYPGVFRLFVPRLKELNWAAGRGGLQGEEDGEGGGRRMGRGGEDAGGPCGSEGGQIGDHRVGGQGSAVLTTESEITGATWSPDVRSFSVVTYFQDLEELDSTDVSDVCSNWSDHWASDHDITRLP